MQNDLICLHLRVVFTFQLMAILLFFLNSLLYLVLQAPVIAGIHLSFGIASSVFLIYMAIKAVFVEIQAVMWCFFVTSGVFLKILTTGGLDSPNIVWLMVILIGGFLVLGSKKGLYLTLFIILLLAMVMWVHFTFDNRFYALPFPVDHAAYIAHSFITAMLCVAIITGIYKILYDKYNWTLRQTEQRALAAEKVKSSFLANMSHEIRTPLNGVMGVTELLLDSDLTTEQLEKVQVLQSSGQQLLTLINDILDLSKL